MVGKEKVSPKIDEGKLLQKFVESSKAVFYLKDQEGHFIYVNHEFEDLFGVKKENVLGKTDYEIGTKEQADQWRINDKKVTKKGSPITFTETAPTKKGTLRYLSHKFPVNNLDEYPNSVGGISFEVIEE